MNKQPQRPQVMWTISTQAEARVATDRLQIRKDMYVIKIENIKIFVTTPHKLGK